MLIGREKKIGGADEDQDRPYLIGGEGTKPSFIDVLAPWDGQQDLYLTPQKVGSVAVVSLFSAEPPTAESTDLPISFPPLERVNHEAFQLPLLSPKELLGLIDLDRVTDREFYNMVSEIVSAQEVEVTQLTAEMKLDEMTGLLNPHAFRRELTSAIERQGRRSDRSGDTDGGLALLFIDLDRFKAVNDNLGHDVGDTAIMSAAKAINGSVRGDRVVGRLGGDEFGVILDGYDEELIGTVIGRIHEAIEDITIANIDNVNFDLSQIGTETELRLGASIGVSYFDPLHPHDTEQMMHEADAAMYRVKQLGNPKLGDMIG